MLDFYVETRVRFSLRDKRLFEITEVEITRVDCIVILLNAVIQARDAWPIERCRSQVERRLGRRVRDARTRCRTSPEVREIAPGFRHPTAEKLFLSTQQ